MRPIALTILFLASATCLHSQQPNGDYRLLEQHERPGNAETPTSVIVSIYVVDILDIDDVERSITLDYFVAQGWNDPRLADDQYEKTKEKLDLTITDIWNPNISPVNIKSLSSFGKAFKYIVIIMPFRSKL